MMDQRLNSLITVIIPTYNRAELISKAIESVQIQTYNHWELIVVDDGSSDKTEEIVLQFIRSDRRIRYIKRNTERQKGANTCRNIGLELSRGNYIKWLDSDDYLAPSCLEMQVKKIIDSEADVCFCQTGKFEERDGKIIHLETTWSKQLFSENVVQSLVFGKLRWATLSGLWKRSYLPERPFHEGLMSAQEWLFHIQVSLRKTSYCFLNEVLCHVRVHPGSMSSHSSKRGKYYYHVSYSNFLAIDLLSRSKPEKYREMMLYLLKKYTRFHAFSLYKGGYTEFILLFMFYPKIFFRLCK